MNLLLKIKRRFRRYPEGVTTQKGTRVFPRASVRTTNGGKLSIGNALVNDNAFVCASGGNIVIEDNVTINRNSVIVSKKSIYIGQGTSIGPNVCIYDHNHKIDKNGFYKDEFTLAPIVIGRNVWIAANCTILKGTVIGDNSIIGAGSIVCGNIPNNTLVKPNRELELIPLHE